MHKGAPNEDPIDKNPNIDRNRDYVGKWSDPKAKSGMMEVGYT